MFRAGDNEGDGGVGKSLLHVSLLRQLKVPDGFADVVEKAGSACVWDSFAEDIAADATLSEGHAAWDICNTGEHS